MDTCAVLLSPPPPLWCRPSHLRPHLLLRYCQIWRSCDNWQSMRLVHPSDSEYWVSDKRRPNITFFKLVDGPLEGPWFRDKVLVSDVEFEDAEAAKNRIIIEWGMLCDKDPLLFCKWRIVPLRSSWQRFGHIIEKIQEKYKKCGYNLEIKYIQNVRLFPTRPYNSYHCALSHLGATKVQKYSVASDDGVQSIDHNYNTWNN